MSLKFGDPQSIAARDKARHDASIKCQTCKGLGVVENRVRCLNEKCELSWRDHKYEHECPCCDGSGEIERKP